MGNSSSQIQADLDAAQKQLAAVSKQRSELQSENAAAAATIAEQKEQLSATVAACEAKLAEQTEALAAAVKKRQVAEDMRRSDALLCKRILAASSADMSASGTSSALGTMSCMNRYHFMIVHE